MNALDAVGSLSKNSTINQPFSNYSSSNPIADLAFSSLKENTIGETHKSIHRDFKVVQAKLEDFKTSTAKSLLPFKVIKYLATNYLEDFILISMNTLRPAEYSNNTGAELTTSCINNAYALSAVFLGKQKAKKMVDRLCTRFAFGLDIALPKGEKWPFWVSNIFGGNIIHEMNRDPTLDSLSKEEGDIKLKQYAAPYVNKFFEYVLPIAGKELANVQETDKIIDGLKQIFRKIDYNFNYLTMESLKNEMTENSKQVNNIKSFIYCIGITNPWHEKDGTMFDHIFILEQFFCSASQEIRFRIYQSWIDKATLLDEMQKHAFGEAGEGSWNNEDLHQFLNNLKALYCQTNLREPIIQETCFGYKMEITSLLRFDDYTLSGLDLRYFSSEFTPGECLENLSALIRANS